MAALACQHERATSGNALIVVTGPLYGRRVVLGVCGGIAAYKAVEVCRRLGDAGARVSPVLTLSAARFVGPLTFSALAAEPARLSLFGDDSVRGPAGMAVRVLASARVPGVAT